MFGHQDDKAHDQPAEEVNEDSSNPQTGPIAEPVHPTAAAADQSWQHPGLPSDDDNKPSNEAKPAASLLHKPELAPTPPTNHSSPHNNELIDIKRQALTQLTPLVGHLDQSPEEKFRTTMMMIQASDDQSLVKTAYQAAQKIDDEKTRAQALLDVINEINYFTQQPEN